MKKSKKWYLYSVAFFHQRGSGCSQIYRKRKINNLKEFNEVRDYIAEENGLVNVAIINFMYLGKERIEIIEEIEAEPKAHRIFDDFPMEV